MKKPRIDTIVWDLDNTPWDWVSFAAKTYPAMRNLIARQTGATRDQVTDCMRLYYGRAETIESSWLIQDLERQGLFKGTKQERRTLINAVQKRFHTCRQKYLRFFGGFPDIFKQAVENGVANVIHTDSPACHAASRIKFFKLDQSLFRSMIAMPDSLPQEVTPKYRKKFEGGSYGLQFPVYYADCEKPNTDLVTPLEMSAEEIGERVAFVDDNYGKGMRSAARFKALGFHALWGQASPKDLGIIAEFSGREIANRNSAQLASVRKFPNVISVNHPMDIAHYMGWR